jgi:hypothetical protein
MGQGAVLNSANLGGSLLNWVSIYIYRIINIVTFFFFLSYLFKFNMKSQITNYLGGSILITILEYSRF